MVQKIYINLLFVSQVFCELKHCPVEKDNQMSKKKTCIRICMLKSS